MRIESDVLYLPPAVQAQLFKTWGLTALDIKTTPVPDLNLAAPYAASYRAAYEAWQRNHDSIVRVGKNRPPTAL